MLRTAFRASRGLHSRSLLAAVEAVPIPPLGESVTTAVVVEWQAEVGSVVKAEEPVLMVETDKIVVDVLAPAAGTLVKQLTAVGDEVTVGQEVFTIDVGVGEPTEAAAADAAPATQAAAATPAPAAADASAASGSAGGDSGSSAAPLHVPSIKFVGPRAPLMKAAQEARDAAAAGYVKLGPLYGRPVLSELEASVIDSGGAFDY